MKRLQVIVEFKEACTPSCADCMFGHDIHNADIECGCGIIHNTYIKGILNGNDPDKDGNHPFMLCTKYDFSKPICKVINEYDEKNL